MGRIVNYALGKPRVDPYWRLLCQFYEPLVLLRVLGQIRGMHITSPEDESTTQFKRRRLLRNLSYLCDYDKGGETTSSIGLEENDRCLIFWVASNTARKRGKAVEFLKSTIAEINRIIMFENEQKDHMERKFINTCIDFSEKRVKKEINLLSRAIKNLKSAELNTESQIATWISQFTPGDGRSIADVCFLAYDQRKAPELRWLENDFVRTSEGTILAKDTVVFAAVRHRLGRLAHHVRAPKEIIDDSAVLFSLFDTYKVCLVEPMPSNTRPEADSLTELASILERMLPADDPKLKEYGESLTFLDQEYDIAKRVRGTYGDKNFQPRIHAEIQVLEHFYRNQLSFAADDRYIGCSKPACYCCHLYFRHHQSKPVEPESHQKIYLNWGVPALPRRAQDPGYNEQRTLMNKMLEIIREDALNQIIQRASPLQWHADSQTGITKSATTRSTKTKSTKTHSRENSPKRRRTILDSVPEASIEDRPSMDSQSFLFGDWSTPPFERGSSMTREAYIEQAMMTEFEV
ncbi:hypothetical protein F4779DRAFT_567224 [Xylariaceae sp. FL0662B]|nr:hypothetical protein F4779DRAFT_567224 [Xylariaceae sp. FL0662B]